MSTDERWRELAELLGIPGDEPPSVLSKSPAPPHEPTHDEAPAPTAAADDDSDADDRPGDETSDAGGDDASEAGGRRRRRSRRARRKEREETGPSESGRASDDLLESADIDPGEPGEIVGDDEPAAESELGEELPGPDSGEPTEENGEPGEERPGGRRRRRRRRGGRSADAEGAEKPATREPQSRDTLAREPINADEDDDVDVESDEDEPVRVAADDDNGDDDFSEKIWADWNVPLWQDLIDSLHRPER